MTWSISKSGTKNEVVEALKVAAPHESTHEVEKASHDRARDYALSHLAAAPDDHDQVNVSASGHSTHTDGVHTASNLNLTIGTHKKPDTAPSEGG